MRFAAIADVHGNYLALEAVLADIRAHGIEDIVNLGDMASGALDARRTVDMLMALDAVHVLGNHDRYLIDRPPEKMGGWDRPAHAQLEAKQLDWLRAVTATRVFRGLGFCARDRLDQIARDAVAGCQQGSQGGRDGSSKTAGD
jgi:3',5'-cyclic AMP phosphodiesterase CpdA